MATPLFPRVDPSILSIFQSRGNEKDNNDEISLSASCMIPSDLGWYLSWLAGQITDLPDCLNNLLAGDGTGDPVDLSPNCVFYRVFMAVDEYIRRDDNLSIDEIVQYLTEDSILESTMVHPDVIPAQRLLIFAIVGWQSMLYLPSFNTCSLRELAIHNDINQPDSTLVFDTFKISAELADRPMATLLKGYGNLLPARSHELTIVASETSRMASSWLPINPQETNAHLLQVLLRIDIRWVDTLALHLDYDKSTRTLSLFRYPSFCIAMLQSRGALYSLASTNLSSSDPRASYDEITDLLLEILLSYRLLFGQSKPSRKLFRYLLHSNSDLSHNADPFLYSICTQKRFAHRYVPQDHVIYFISRDFPVLGRRVELLATELKDAKPKTWKDLLRDRRDTTQYWAFWLVAIVGGISILLSLVQVILQAIQIVRA